MGEKLKNLNGNGKQKCTKCIYWSVSGLINGAGKCPFHWAEGVWGKEHASKCYPNHPEANKELK